MARAKASAKKSAPKKPAPAAKKAKPMKLVKALTSKTAAPAKKVTSKKAAPPARAKTPVAAKPAATAKKAAPAKKVTAKATPAARPASKPAAAKKKAPASKPVTVKKAAPPAPKPVELADGSTVVATGRHLQLLSRNGWEFVRRRNVSGVVGIIAQTEHQQLLLVEQYREPIGRRTIELPAGLAGDISGMEEEDFVNAAARELVEETGYRARTWEPLNEGPSSAGLTDETTCLFLARNAFKVGPGGGHEGEDIQVHCIAISDLPVWLSEQVAAGKLVDHKIYAGLFFLLTDSGPHLSATGMTVIDADTQTELAVTVETVHAHEVIDHYGDAHPEADVPEHVVTLQHTVLSSDDVPLEESLSLPVEDV